MEDIKKVLPKISVITVVLNNKNTIEETINSVLNQKYPNLEYIIIDGGSTDGTLEIINKYKEQIYYFKSEKDLGIYDAFNKGLKIASGDLIGFINSDDIYTENCFKILKEYYFEHPNKDFFFGAVKKHWGVLHGYKPWKIKFSWGFYSSHSTGFFIKNSSAKIVGTYNLKYKYSSDFDYFYRMIVKHELKGVATKKNELFGVFRRGGYSSTIPFINRTLEEIQIRKDNGQSKLTIMIILIFKLFKNFNKINQ
tara:strand:+ start:199 stop:954 length:756 start_codon:yes stop_codon:yes gene_type:complete